MSLGSQWGSPAPRREDIPRLERGRSSSECSEAVETLEAAQGLSLPSCLCPRAAGAARGNSGEGREGESRVP